MTVASWDWLPDTALTDSRTTALIDRALSDWSDRWFPTFVLERQRLEPASNVGPAIGEWGLVRIHMSEKSAIKLAGHALDLDLERLEISDADQTVIDAFARELLGTLAESLALAAGGRSSVSEVSASADMHLQLCDTTGDKVMTVALPKATLAAARRRALPARRSVNAPPLVALSEALNSQVVKLTGRLGQASLSLADTRHLSVGDVVVIDQRLDDPFDVLLDPTVSVIACASLVDTASPRSLSLQPARSVT